ncbi:hypothetical protein [Aurantimonas coralicida]|uniref:hypothetical protein n=1 Tax=Aurantimonas coralicida TaxID=182270 RepID=UPI001D1844AB|nr:hypothetical protein [Aurantimonas coralicida]MCC4298126.1 hypothetical protein [Aurantimonas coralicida]
MIAAKDQDNNAHPKGESSNAVDRREITTAELLAELDAIDAEPVQVAAPRQPSPREVKLQEQIDAASAAGDIDQALALLDELLAASAKMSGLLTAAPTENDRCGPVAQGVRPIGAETTSVYKPLPTPAPIPTPSKTDTGEKDGSGNDENEDAPALPTPAYALPVHRPGLRRRRTPKRHDELDTVGRLCTWHNAMATLGEVHAFTLNLAPKAEAALKTKKSAASALLTSISRHLKRELKRPVAVMLALEEAPRRRRLHLHGELQITTDEAARARKALRRAVGEWESARQHQAKTVPAPDLGWIAYTAKDRHRLEKGGAYDRYIGRSISGSHIAASIQVKRKAQTLYNAWRKAYIAQSRRGTEANKSSVTYSSGENTRDIRNNTLDTDSGLNHNDVTEQQVPATLQKEDYAHRRPFRPDSPLQSDHRRPVAHLPGRPVAVHRRHRIRHQDQSRPDRRHLARQHQRRPEGDRRGPSRHRLITTQDRLTRPPASATDPPAKECRRATSPRWSSWNESGETSAGVLQCDQTKNMFSSTSCLSWSVHYDWSGRYSHREFS